MAELVSPNVLNYAVFKGNVYFTPSGGGTRRHLGNATTFSLEPTINKLDHFSSMTGIRSKDKSVIIEKSFTLSLVLEEMTLKNFQLALLGGAIAADTDTTDGGLQGFEIGAVASTNGIIEFDGTNDVGPQYKMTLYSVDISPDGAVEFIGDNDWANVALTGDVLAVNGSFGRFDLKDSETTTT